MNVSLLPDRQAAFQNYGHNHAIRNFGFAVFGTDQAQPPWAAVHPHQLPLIVFEMIAKPSCCFTKTVFALAKSILSDNTRQQLVHKASMVK